MRAAAATFSILALLAAYPVRSDVPGKLMREGWELLRERDAISAQTALLRFRQAVEEARESGDRAAELKGLEGIGSAYSTMGEFRQAIEIYGRITELARSLRNTDMEAYGLREAGLALTNLGDAAHAVEPLERSLAIPLSESARFLEGKTRSALGWAYWNLGDYEKALEQSGKALAIAERFGQEEGQGWALSNVGLAYWSLGEPSLAREALERALPHLKRAHERLGERLTIHYLGLAALSEGNLPRAGTYFRETLRLAEEARDPQTEALAHDNLGQLASLAGDYHTAREEISRALVLWRRSGDRRGEARSLENLGKAKAFGGQAEEGQSELLESLSIRRGQEDRASVANSLTALADTALRTGRLEDAHERLEEAMSLLESLRATVLGRDLRATFLAVRQSPFELNVELFERLYERKPTPEAAAQVLEAVERARARTLLEAVSDVRAREAPDASTPASQTRAPGSLPGRTVPGKAIASFYVLRDHVLVVVLDSRGAHITRLQPSPEEMSESVANYVDLIARDEATDWEAMGHRLFAEIVEPWLREIGPSVRRLVVIPDGFLHRLPFEALVVGREPLRYLAEDVCVSYGPSIRVLDGLRRQQTRNAGTSRRGLLALAAPFPATSRQTEAALLYAREGFQSTPLPDSRREAEAICRWAGTDSLLLEGRAASEARVKKEDLSRFRVVHFATHGIVLERAPSRSALVLTPDDDGGSEDGFLQAREIYGLRLESDLVVLSACQTARGRFLKGEGVQGLVQAFFHAGTRSVVASLWDVPDRSTAEFMERFYRALASGEKEAEALRRTKLALLGQSRTRAPLYWASFVLLGEGDERIALRGPPALRRLPPWGWLLSGAILLSFALFARGQRAPCAESEIRNQ